MAKRPDLNTLVRKRIVALRRQAGFTQEQLCEKARISIDSVTRIETGARRPSLTTLGRIAWALGVAPADLLQDAGAPPVERTSHAAKLLAMVEREDAATQAGAVEIVRTYLSVLRRHARHELQ
jgi:transcriptional regulator with XRE-family HTH domain